MRGLDPWKYLVEVLGIPEILFDWCRYGKPYKKVTRVISNFPWFERLQKRCHHKGKHVVLEGAATTKAGAYSVQFCKAVAKHCWDFWPVNVGNDRVPEKESKAPKSRKPASPLWAVQLSESLSWKPFMQYSFRHVAHINLQETKARRSLVKRLRRDRRVVVMQDSRVNLGSLGKGRSPSISLNTLMRQEAPYILGKNLYLAGTHLPTWSIRADGPSRQRPIDPPRIPVPSWFWQLRQHRVPVADPLADLEGLPRAYARWALLVGQLLLGRVGLCASTTQPAKGARAPLAGAHHRKDQSFSGRTAAQVCDVVNTTNRRLHPGYFGPEAYRYFIRILGRIYHTYVRLWTIQGGCSRDRECHGADIWMAEVLTCRALGNDSVLGKSRTFTSSPANPSSCSACTCGLCTGLAMAQSGGDVGAWLFCFAETCRMYWTTAARLGLAQRPPRRGRHVCADRGPKDPVSHFQESACASRRARAGIMDCMDSWVACRCGNVSGMGPCQPSGCDTTCCSARCFIRYPSCLRRYGPGARLTCFVFFRKTL